MILKLKLVLLLISITCFVFYFSKLFEKNFDELYRIFRKVCKIFHFEERKWKFNGLSILISLITMITVMKHNGFGGIPALKILNLANNILTGMDTKVFEFDHYVDVQLK